MATKNPRKNKLRALSRLLRYADEQIEMNAGVDPGLVSGMREIRKSLKARQSKLELLARK